MNHKSLFWSHKPKICKNSIFNELFFPKQYLSSLLLELNEWILTMKSNKIPLTMRLYIKIKNYQNYLHETKIFLNSNPVILTLLYRKLILKSALRLLMILFLRFHVITFKMILVDIFFKEFFFFFNFEQFFSQYIRMDNLRRNYKSKHTGWNA